MYNPLVEVHPDAPDPEDVSSEEHLRLVALISQVLAERRVRASGAGLTVRPVRFEIEAADEVYWRVLNPLMRDAMYRAFVAGAESRS